MVIAYTGFRPHECRVMRENKITPDHPKGKSKGFGFMSFNTHQEALTALRKLNNNPKIFGTQHVGLIVMCCFILQSVNFLCFFQSASHCCLQYRRSRRPQSERETPRKIKNKQSHI